MLSVATILTAIAWGIGDGLNGATAIARVIYAMGRDGVLPRAVAKVHSKFSIPWVATIIGGVISTLIAILLPLDLLVSLVNFSALTAFILLHIAVIYYFTYICININSGTYRSRTNMVGDSRWMPRSWALRGFRYGSSVWH